MKVRGKIRVIRAMMIKVSAYHYTPGSLVILLSTEEDPGEEWNRNDPL